MANGRLGFPRNLGDPVVSTANSRREYRVTNSRLRRPYSAGEERNTSATVVPPSEGNEVRRDGRQEVIVP